jgi:hypothetical protein
VTGRRGQHITARWKDRSKLDPPLSILAVLIVATVALCSSALAAPAGSYKGKIEYQGYDVTFKVSKNGKRVTDLVARMLVDCEGDGYSETFLIAPTGSWPIKNGKVSGKRTDRVDQSKATVELNGRFTGRKFKGFVREVDFLEGSGIVCDTLERKFTAKRG